MKRFRYLFCLLIFFCDVESVTAQEGFVIINKAEKEYELGNYRKALILLADAEKTDYGFCGNAWDESNISINLLRAKIYIAQNKYQFARNCLDSICRGGNDIDSIKIRTYQLEIGKDSLRKMIDSSLTNAYLKCVDLNCYMIIPLINGKSELKFKLNTVNSYRYSLEKDEVKKKELWLTEFLKSKSYALIKEE